jgi:uncharacterized membrane protein YfhO
VVGKLLDHNIDLKQELVILSKDVIRLDEPAARGQVKPLSYGANMISLACVTEGDAFLYVSDAYYPGWKAYLDGKETLIYQANLAFRAVYVPRGTHTVSFFYRPLSVYIGFCLTVLGFLISLFILITCRSGEGMRG